MNAGFNPGKIMVPLTTMRVSLYTRQLSYLLLTNAGFQAASLKRRATSGLLLRWSTASSFRFSILIALTDLKNLSGSWLVGSPHPVLAKYEK